VATSVVVAEELQEQLLAREEKLTRREKALDIREEKAMIFEMATAKVSADLDTERVKTEATRHEYLDKMQAHTTRAKHTLGLNKILG
jgi:FixJ family two-component response regulator